MKDFQEKNNSYQEQYMAMENELNKQKSVILEFQNQMAASNLQRDKMRSDLQSKESQLKRFEGEMLAYQ